MKGSRTWQPCWTPPPPLAEEDGQGDPVSEAQGSDLQAWTTPSGPTPTRLGNGMTKVGNPRNVLGLVILGAPRRRMAGCPTTR